MTIKFTWKILLLIFVLTVSLLSIFTGSLEIKFLVFAFLLLFIILTLFSKSNKLIILNFLILVALIIVLIYSSMSQQGIIITSVEANSTAFEQGLRQGQIIQEIDSNKIKSLEDFSQAFQGKFSSNESVKTTIQTDTKEIILFGKTAPEITVASIPKTNIKTGLDLAGGSRALIQAQDKKLSRSEINDLVRVVSNRLNVYGISDMKILPVSDLSGNNFMLIEIAGATPEDLEQLISEQGKFEAKIGNETVFVGGEKDITSVCRTDGACARIEVCDRNQNAEGYFCRFSFEITLSAEAAQKHSDITSTLTVNTTNQGNYLSENLDLYVDDNLVDSLLISENLQGRVTTQIQISGSGFGETEADAFQDAKLSMNQLQTILITGSLPYKLEIVKLDTISPILGKQFTRSIFLAGISAILAVSIIIFFRYKKIKSSLALLTTSLSEVIIILGIASIINWNLDLPSIAGILATIGTGIDQQIIVMDEARQSQTLSLKQRLKRAFAIILGAYFTALVALLPLYWAGAGLLKGFAVTSIIGITAGVLITRPAFTDMIRKIEE